MGLWSAREEAVIALSAEFSEQAALLDETFAVFDECITELSGVEPGSPYSRVAAMTAAKARNLCLGSYSLILDGIAQEAGALLRPLIEGYELLVYLRLDPRRADEAIEGRLPSAGERARLIAGQLHDVRKYLNEHASHFSFSFDSLRHVFDPSSMSVRTSQPFAREVFLQNLCTLLGVMQLVASEAAQALAAAGSSKAEALATRLDKIWWRGRAAISQVFTPPSQ
jgi:hypothetical protein